MAYVSGLMTDEEMRAARKAGYVVETHGEKEDGMTNASIFVECNVNDLLLTQAPVLTEPVDLLTLKKACARRDEERPAVSVYVDISWGEFMDFIASAGPGADHVMELVDEYFTEKVCKDHPAALTGLSYQVVAGWCPETHNHMAFGGMLRVHVVADEIAEVFFD